MPLRGRSKEIVARSSMRRQLQEAGQRRERMVMSEVGSVRSNGERTSVTRRIIFSKMKPPALEIYD